VLERFNYINPNNLQEAFSAMEHYSSGQLLLLAGGTDLIPQLRKREKHAECILDLGGLGLDYIKREDGQIRIGALTTFRTIIRDKNIGSELPILAQAAGKVGAIQTQSLATMGGNLCSGLPSADSATPLMVLNAQLRLVSKERERLVAVKDFFIGPGKTVLQVDEILKEIIIPLDQSLKANFLKIGRRKAMSLPIINCSASLRLDRHGLIEAARIALGSVGPIPVRVKLAEELLMGKNPSIDLFEQAGKITSEQINPRSSIRGSSEYRRLLSEIVVKRNLSEVMRQFRQESGKDRTDNEID
jgi:CO/xanthine dehydrogenase FAD-binding subunit